MTTTPGYKEGKLFTEEAERQVWETIAEKVSYAALYGGQKPTQERLAFCTRVGKPQMIDPGMTKVEFLNPHQEMLVPAWVAVFDVYGRILFTFHFKNLPPGDYATVTFASSEPNEETCVTTNVVPGAIKDVLTEENVITSAKIGRLTRVAYLKKGPRYGDLYLALAPDDAWDNAGEPLEHITLTQPAGGTMEAPVFYISAVDRSLAIVLGLMFHHSATIESINGWATNFGVDELRFEVEEHGV